VYNGFVGGIKCMTLSFGLKEKKKLRKFYIEFGKFVETLAVYIKEQNPHIEKMIKLCNKQEDNKMKEEVEQIIKNYIMDFRK
jgi:hypothetical protein